MMSINKKWIIAILLGLITPKVAAQSGTINMPTDFGTSARTIALGGIEGVHSSAYSLFENPAALPKDTTHHYSVFYMQLADKQSGYITAAASYPLGKGHIAFGFTQEQNPDIDHTSQNSNNEFISNGTFSPKQSMYQIGYQYPLKPNLSLGAALHYFSHDQFVTEGNGFNSTIGVQWDKEKWLMSLTAKNILASKVSYNNGYDDLKFPSELVASARYNVTQKIGLYGQLKSDHMLKAAGLRYTPFPYIDLLLGWNQIRVVETDDKVSLGLTLNLNTIAVHFSYQDTDVVENGQLYGISIDFQI